MRENVLKEKSFRFSVRIVKLYVYLRKTHSEYIVSQQLIRSGTAVGALIREAEYAESRKDFIHKLCISLKEANESDYWLDILQATGFITVKMYDSLKQDCAELLKLLTASIKTSRQRTKKIIHS